VTETTDVRVVPMRAEHIDALMPYERAMFGSEAWTRGGYRAELADTRHRTYVAAESSDGALLGWAGVRVVADEAEILTVGVVPHARRRGIARMLLAVLLDTARSKGARTAYLEVRTDNGPARTLYAREGFAELGVRPGYYDAGRADAVVMSRDL
jgi:[ribosomal protein S18]-alanine N-acetyltransferase